MKTKKQILAFLKTAQFATAKDCEAVSLFCQNNCGLTPKDFPTFTEPGKETSQTFIEWYKNGFGVGEFARTDKGSLVLVVNALHNKTATCINLSKLEKTGKKWEPALTERRCSSLTKIENGEEQLGHSIWLSKNGWEFDYERQDLREKHIPVMNERVEFSKGDYSGIGVVRSVNPSENTVELYCYFIYNDKRLGHSMHEKGICDLHSFQFNPMTVVALRRMNRELARYGKTWNDKLHRIEPLQVKAEKGQPYCYINDKLVVAHDREKGTPTSHFRYIAGNYFTDENEALRYLDVITEILRDRLAK